VKLFIKHSSFNTLIAKNKHLKILVMYFLSRFLEKLLFKN